MYYKRNLWEFSNFYQNITLAPIFMNVPVLITKVKFSWNESHLSFHTTKTSFCQPQLWNSSPRIFFSSTQHKINRELQLNRLKKSSWRSSNTVEPKNVKSIKEIYCVIKTIFYCHEANSWGNSFHFSPFSGTQKENFFNFPMEVNLFYMRNEC